MIRRAVPHARRAPARRAPARRTPGDDGGFTLVETIVAMSVMSIFLTVFTGSVVMMFRSSNHSQAVAHSSQELSDAFLWLDRHVRYASYVSQPGQDANDGGNWYVEFQDTNTTPATCYQLRVDQVSQQLQQRSWAGTAAPSSWAPLATGITNGGATGANAPFALTPARATVPSAQLTVDLVAAEGSGTEGASSQNSLSFTALNTTLSTPVGGLCTGARP